MAVEKEAQVSEAQIAVHWPEEEFYHPPATFIAQANAADPAIFQRFSEEHFPNCYREYADLLTWDALVPWRPARNRGACPGRPGGKSPHSGPTG